MARAADDAAAHPGENILIVCVELCSLSYHPDDASIPTFITNALCGDAAAAAVVRGDDECTGFRLMSTFEYLVPDTLETVRYVLDERGFHFMTEPSILGLVDRLAPDLLKWLEAQYRDRRPVEAHRPDFLLSHTAGPRVMDQIRDALAVDEALLMASRASLRERGNISSATVLDVLRRTFDNPPAAGAEGLALALAPGFSAIAVRGRWHEHR